MKKQTFFQLANSHEILTADQARQIIGGGGVITGGSGSPTDPYIVSTTYITYDSRSGTYASGLANQMNSMGVYTMGGEDFYQNDATSQMVSNRSDALTAQDNLRYTGYNGSSASMGNIFEASASGIGQDSNGNPILGYTSDGITAVDYNAIDNKYAQAGFDQGGNAAQVANPNGSGMLNVTTLTKDQIITNLFGHEGMHQIGADDTNQGVMNQVLSTNDGSNNFGWYSFGLNSSDMTNAHTVQSTDSNQNYSPTDFIFYF